nr:verprolin like [Tanacetum cinerariifolium]GEY31626.1 verprolin like [Tanacetum cinerariifolium]
MNYPNSSVLDTSLVNGTLESLKLDHGFKPVSVLGFTRFGYKFSYISKEVENGGFSGYDGVENRTLSPPNGICSVITWGLRFELDYSEYDCKDVSCSFETMGDEIFPRLMSIKVLDCLEDGKVSKLKKGTYRDEIFTNLRFDMLLKNKQGQMAYGYASPLYIGDKFYNPYIKSGQWNSSNGYINISYVISFTTRGEFEFGGKVPASKMVEISAEGVYNTKNGVICMIGCRHMPYEKFQRTRSLDCELVINIKYPPLHGQDGEMVHGTIKSTRKKPDPLYFEPIEFSSSSITTLQARESIWRMDLEITMVLVSNTLACIFIGLQLFHVKRNPEIIPFVSIVMLVVLTLGYMIPLLLNFEAIFMANRKQNVFLGTDQWLEVNEVLVRVITMVAFLLQFRLLQLTWSSRKGHESQTNLWISDKKVLYVAIPLYIAFGLTAWVVHLLQNSHTKTQQFHSRVLVSNTVTFWGELKSYVGLVLDAYLIPQIMFNLFCDMHGTILTPLYYVGSTMVRLLPRVYDLYRTHSSSWVYDKIYANPGMDYYSTMWDVVICFSGLICVVVIYVQQRFGGRSVMPKRFRDSVLYQKVPVIIIPEQQIF